MGGGGGGGAGGIARNCQRKRKKRRGGGGGGGWGILPCSRNLRKGDSHLEFFILCNCRHENWFKGKALKSGAAGVQETPPKKRNYPQRLNLCNPRLSWGQFYGNKVYFFLCTATDWNHLSDDQVKAPHFRTSKPKVRSCDNWNQDQELQHHKTACRCVPGFISTQTFTSSSISFLP